MRVLWNCVKMNVNPGNDLKSLKTLYRKKIMDELRLIPEESKRIQAESVCRKITELPQYKKSQRISIYLSTDLELNTTNIIEQIFKDGKNCFVPRYEKKKMEMVKLLSMTDFYQLPKNNIGIKQPLMSEPRENALDTGGLDMVIVPGVAFTPQGQRLGHGGGYYDRFFKQLRNIQEHSPFFVGIGFKAQILNELPVEEHDELLDMVIYADDKGL